MKKLLTALSALVLSSSLGASVVSCSGTATFLSDNNKGDQGSEKPEPVKIEVIQKTNKFIIDEKGQVESTVHFNFETSNAIIDSVNFLNGDSANLDTKHFSDWFEISLNNAEYQLNLKKEKNIEDFPLKNIKGIIFNLDVKYHTKEKEVKQGKDFNLTFDILDEYKEEQPTPPVTPPTESGDEIKQQAISKVDLNQIGEEIKIDKKGNTSDKITFNVKNKDQENLIVNEVKIDDNSDTQSDDTRRHSNWLKLINGKNGYEVEFNSDKKDDLKELESVINFNLSISITVSYKEKEFTFDKKVIFNLINNYEEIKPTPPLTNEELLEQAKKWLKLNQSNNSITLDKDGKTKDDIKFNIENSNSSEVSISSINLNEDQKTMTDDMKRFGELFKIESNKGQLNIKFNEEKLNDLLKLSKRELKDIHFNLLINIVYKNTKLSYLKDVKFNLINNYEEPIVPHIPTENEIKEEILNKTDIKLNEEIINVDTEFNYGSIKLTPVIAESDIIKNLEITNLSIYTEKDNTTDDTIKYGNLFTITKQENDYILSLKSKEAAQTLPKDITDLHFAIAIDTTSDKGEIKVIDEIRFKTKVDKIVKNDLQEVINQILGDKPTIQLEKIDRTNVDQISLENQIKVLLTNKLSDAIMNQIYYLDSGNIATKQVILSAKKDSKKYSGIAIINFEYDKDPKIIPDLDEGDIYDMGILNGTDMLKFSNMEMSEKQKLIKQDFAEKYKEIFNDDIYSRFFNDFHFFLQNDDLNDLSESRIGKITAIVKTKYEGLPVPNDGDQFKFTIKYEVPYTPIADVIPDNIFIEPINNDDKDDESKIIEDLMMQGNKVIDKFSENFDLDINKEDNKATIIAKENNIYYVDKNDKMTLEYIVGKKSILEILKDIPDSYEFNKGYYALMTYDYIMNEKPPLALAGKSLKDWVSSKAGVNKDFVTIDNEWNKTHYVSSDPETWTFRIMLTDKGKENYAGYKNLKLDFTPAVLDTWINGSDKPEYENKEGSYFDINAKYLVSSHEEIKNSIIEGFNKEAGKTYENKMELGNWPYKYNSLDPSTWKTQIVATNKYSKYMTGWLNELHTFFKLQKLDLTDYLKEFKEYVNKAPLALIISESNDKDSDLANEIKNKIIGVDNLPIQQYPDLDGHISIDIKRDKNNPRLGIATITPGSSNNDKEYMTGKIVIPYVLSSNNNISNLSTSDFTNAVEKLNETDFKDINTVKNVVLDLLKKKFSNLNITKEMFEISISFNETERMHGLIRVRTEDPNYKNWNISGNLEFYAEHKKQG